MGSSNDVFTIIEWCIFRVFVLACLVIAVVRIVAKELGEDRSARRVDRPIESAEWSAKKPTIGERENHGS
jgi:hypothetical protein